MTRSGERWRVGISSGALLGVLLGCGGASTTPLPDAVTPDGAITADAAIPDASDDAAIPDAAIADGEFRDSGHRPDAGDAGPERLGPPYPVVLAHGFFGFEDFAGAGYVTYFWGVKDDLALDRESLVFTPAVDPFNDSTTRGAQLGSRIEAILAATGHAKVNLVGHSQGGLDARVVAHDRPELVASVMTIATPHAGTPLADTLIGAAKNPGISAFVDAAVRLVGAPLYDAVGDETSVMASFRQLGTTGMAEFNEAYPHPLGIPTWSIAGRTDLHRGGADCRSAMAPAFITRWDDERDPVDPLLAVSEALLDGSVLAPVPNDGLVRVADARWGTFLGCIPADHLDQMGQLFGDHPGVLNDFDHRAFYRGLVRWLRSQGL